MVEHVCGRKSKRRGMSVTRHTREEKDDKGTIKNIQEIPAEDTVEERN